MIGCSLAGGLSRGGMDQGVVGGEGNGLAIRITHGKTVVMHKSATTIRYISHHNRAVRGTYNPTHHIHKLYLLYFILFP